MSIPNEVYFYVYFAVLSAIITSFGLYLMLLKIPHYRNYLRRKWRRAKRRLRDLMLSKKKRLEKIDEFVFKSQDGQVYRIAPNYASYGRYFWMSRWDIVDNIWVFDRGVEKVFVESAKKSILSGKKAKYYHQMHRENLDKRL